MPLLILLLLTVTAANYLINHGSASAHDSDINIIITSSCSNTLYPDICYSTLDLVSTQNINIATKKDVIELTVNKTKANVEATFQAITNMTMLTTTAAKMEAHHLLDCLDMEAANLEQLDTVIRYLRDDNKPLRHYASDLKTLMSTTITNKETCLDGLDDIDHAIKGQLEHGGKMCSNVLAMIKNITDTEDIDDQVNINIIGRNLRENKQQQQQQIIMWPEWLSAGDRRLLWFGGVTPDVTVAKDGKGNFKTVAEAVEAAPNKSTKRYVIKIMAGTYKENIKIARSKHNIMFIGEGRGKTTITGNKNVASGDGTTTINTATVAVLGQRFLARDITFENTAGPSGHQAVALRVASDLSAFYKCSMEGYQDTLYVHTNRQFYVNCLITGTIDFIFGNAAVVFQFCDIMVRKPNPGQRNMVTAQGRTDKNQETGIVIQKCNIKATAELKAVQGNFSTYLGRPWKMFSRTVVMRSVIGEVIMKEGWHPWDGDFALDTLYYREYQNKGAGSDTSKRVTWKGWGVIKDRKEARPFTVANFINGWTWLLSTGFPFWPAL